MPLGTKVTCNEGGSVSDEGTRIATGAPGVPGDLGKELAYVGTLRHQGTAPGEEHRALLARPVNRASEQGYR
ncbi:hypothetical protein GCM10023350_14120 [Nocardioides endophyticus]|uniref:Uncharacterized protein n=1 Tax=Nocardioides endophyticus TaxID=1353775 RepID=A0ABP8YJC8_9ACTN